MHIFLGKPLASSPEKKLNSILYYNFFLII